MTWYVVRHGCDGTTVRETPDRDEAADTAWDLDRACCPAIVVVEELVTY